MGPNVLLTLYYYKVLCRKDDISCIHEYTMSGEYYFMKFRVTSLLRSLLLRRIMFTCTYDSHNIAEGLFGSYDARLRTKF